MSRGVAVVVTLVSLSSLACVTTHPIARPSTVEDIDRLAGVAPGSREVPEIRLVTPGLKSAWVRAPERPEDVKLEKIRAVEVRHRGRGAAEGAGLGLLTGAATGVAAGLLAGSDDAHDFFAFTAPEKAALFGAFLGLSGAVIGAVFGAVNGHVDRYEF